MQQKSPIQIAIE